MSRARCRRSRSWEEVLRWNRPRPSRPSCDHLTAGTADQNPTKRRAEAKRRMAEVLLFYGALPSRLLLHGDHRRRKIAATSANAGPARPPSDRPLEGRRGSVLRQALMVLTAAARRQEADDVRWHELNAQGCSELVDAEGAQIFVEGAKPRRQRDRLDCRLFQHAASGLSPLRLLRVGVTSDIGPAQVRREQHGREEVSPKVQRAIGKVGSAGRRESTVSMPSPAASTSFATRRPVPGSRMLQKPYHPRK